MPWAARCSQIACVVARMWSSLNEVLSDDPRWPEVPKATVTSSLAFYKKNVFSSDNIVGEESYGRLLGILKDRQFTPEQMDKVAYKSAINMDFVRKARAK